MNIYLTTEDLGYKPGVVEQDKFEYSPLGKVFNEGLNGKDKKEEILKRLKNIESKNEKQSKMQLETIKNDLEIANKKAFQKLMFLNQLLLQTKSSMKFKK